MNQHLLVNCILCLYLTVAFVAAAANLEDRSTRINNLKSENIKETVHDVEYAKDELEDSVRDVKDVIFDVKVDLEVVRTKMSTSSEVRVIRTIVASVLGSLGNQGTKFNEDIAALSNQNKELKEGIAQMKKALYKMQTLLESGKNIVMSEYFDETSIISINLFRPVNL